MSSCTTTSQANSCQWARKPNQGKGRPIFKDTIQINTPATSKQTKQKQQQQMPTFPMPIKLIGEERRETGRGRGAVRGKGQNGRRRDEEREKERKRRGRQEMRGVQEERERDGHRGPKAKTVHPPKNAPKMKNYEMLPMQCLTQKLNVSAFFIFVKVFK